MKMPNILLVIMTSVIYTGSAYASILSTHSIEKDLISLAENSSDELAAQRLYGRIIYKENSPKKVMSVWSSYDKQGDYGTRWGEVGLNILRWSNVSEQPNWGSGVTLPGEHRLVYQQDSLVDLDRVAYHEVKYSIKSHNGLLVRDIMNPIRKPSRTSHRLMLEGRAPIGDDNYPIMVCRIGQSSQAPYVEISKSQMKSFTKITGLDYSSCLFGDSENNYWKARLKDFIDEQNIKKEAVDGYKKAS